MSLLADIGALMETKFGLTIGTDLFLGQQPDSVDTCVTVYARPGAVQFTMGAEDNVQHDPALEQPRLQVVVRRANSATAYPDGEDQVYAIYRGLSLTNVTLNGTRYVAIEPVGTPAPLEEDAEGRLSFVANFMVTREPESLA